MHKTLSIVTICFNSKESIFETINSVKSIKNSSVEYIVIDGNSNDGTKSIIEDNIDIINKFVSEKDQGISDAFNKGIALSEGEFVFFLNSGDRFHKDFNFEQLLLELSKTLDDIIYYDVKVKENLFIPSKKYKNNNSKIKKYGDIPHQGAFIRRFLFDRVGTFNLNYKIRMDLDFFSRCITEPNVIINKMNGIVCDYQEGGISMKKSNRIDFLIEGVFIKSKYKIKINFKEKIKTLLYLFGLYKNDNN